LIPKAWLGILLGNRHTKGTPTLPWLLALRKKTDLRSLTACITDFLSRKKEKKGCSIAPWHNTTLYLDLFLFMLFFSSNNYYMITTESKWTSPW
jgi:hypothetical protein